MTATNLRIGTLVKTPEGQGYVDNIFDNCPDVRVIVDKKPRWFQIRELEIVATVGDPGDEQA